MKEKENEIHFPIFLNSVVLFWLHKGGRAEEERATGMTARQKVAKYT